MQKFMIRKKLIFKWKVPKNKLRLYIFKFVNSWFFEFFITMCILSNTLVMAMRYYRMNSIYDRVLEIANYVFAFIFTVECILKIISELHGYFMNNWNWFDFLVVVGTLIGVIMTVLQTDFNFSTAASAIWAFWILRIFRLIWSSKNLWVLIDTLMYILPSLFNVGSLIILMLLIFSVLGINLFSQVMLQTELNENANF